MGDSLLSLGCVVVFRGLPSRLHHLHEVLVGWDTHREVLVIVEELIKGDLAVIVATGTIELVQEIGQNLVLSETLFNEIGVPGHIVDTANIRYRDRSISRLVHHGESFENHILSSWGQVISKK